MPRIASFTLISLVFFFAVPAAAQSPERLEEFRTLVAHGSEAFDDERFE